MKRLFLDDPMYRQASNILGGQYKSYVSIYFAYGQTSAVSNPYKNVGTLLCCVKHTHYYVQLKNIAPYISESQYKPYIARQTCYCVYRKKHKTPTF